MANYEIPSIDPNAAVVRAPGLHEARLDDAVVVLDQRSDQCHVLGGAAGSIWSLIDDRRTSAEITKELGTLLSAETADIGPEVLAAVQGLQGIGIVELTELQSPSNRSQFETSADGISLAVSTAGSISVSNPIDVQSRRSKWGPTMVRLVGGWDSGVVLGPFAFGDVSVRIATDIPEIAVHLRTVLRAMDAASSASQTGKRCDVVIARDHKDSESRCRIWIDGLLHRRQYLTSLSVEYVMTELNLVAVSGTGDSLLFHAGAVERDGRVVVIAGISGRGKSTLTAALVRAGFRYVTDEMAIIDPKSGWVRPYLKPLDLDDSSLDLLGLGGRVDENYVVEKFRVDPLVVGDPSTGGQIAMVVVLTDDGGTEVMEDAEVLAPVDALSAILPNVFAETYGISDPLQKIVDLCELHPVIALPRLPLGESVAIIEQVLSTR